MRRWLPLLLVGSAAVLALSIAEAGAATMLGEAQDRRQVAQNWTPLTGPLGRRRPGEAEPEEETETPAKKTPEAETPKDDEPGTSGASDSSGAPSGMHSLTVKATLGKADDPDGRDHGMLGVVSTSLDKDLVRGLELDNRRGALLLEIKSGSAAAAAGLRVGDIVVSIGGKEVGSHEELVEQVRATASGTTVEIEALRAGEGDEDLKRLLIERSDANNVSATAALARMYFLGMVVGKDQTEAARLFLKAAKAGHVASMTSYGLLAKDGVGVAKNDNDAAIWFLRAAEKDNVLAMSYLASMYEAGRGATKDEKEAARWYRKAADGGNPLAMYRLALMLESGRGVTKDQAEAVRYFRMASDKGLSESTAKLADKYARGQGVDKDQGEADRLNERAADQVRRSAEQGIAVSMFNLGILYRTGKGVAKSDSEGGKWVIRAFKAGDKYLINELMRNPNILSQPDRRWLQGVLKDEGAYSGPIDGQFGDMVRTAMESLEGKP